MHCLFWWMQVFLIRKHEQAKLSDLGIGAPEGSVWDIAQVSLYHGVVALSEREIIGSYFFENKNVTGSTYKRIVRYFLFPELWGYPQDKIFSQVGAPPHYSFEVRQYSDRKLPGRWMDRGWGNYRVGLREVYRWPNSGRRRSLYGEKSRYDRTVTTLIRTHVSTNCKQATRAAKPP